MITGELKNKINGIWDIFWSSGLTNPLTVIEQITYLMFIKILDDNELKRERNAATFGLELNDPIFDKAYQNCRWHIFKNYSSDAMFENMIENVFPFIKNDISIGKDTAFAKYMKDAVFLIPSPMVLDKVVSALDDLNMDDKDIMGDVYEYLLSKISTAGKIGQFRTPRHIINMMVELLKPTIKDKVCDPAMGSAGFICSAAHYITEHFEKELMEANNKHHFLNNMFTGFDTDQTMLRIGAMNMMLRGVEAPHITWLDSLSVDNEHRNEFSLILANPPFTGNLFKETISKDLLSVASTTKTELLFLILFLKMLKIGGRCASIVPDGVLFGSSKAHKAIRKELVENQRLQAVISMPSGVFKPYAGVSTAILIFTKTDNGGTDKVWFYDMKSDGFSLDDKRSPVEDNDIPDLIERFNNLEKEKERQRTEQSFLVDKKEIVDNNYDLSINKYKEIEYIPVEYPSTSEIMDNIMKLEKQVAKELEELRKLLEE